MATQLLDYVIDVDAGGIAGSFANAYPLSQILRSTHKDHAVLERHLEALAAHQGEILFKRGTRIWPRRLYATDEASAIRRFQMLRRELPRCDVEALVLHC